MATRRRCCSIAKAGSQAQCAGHSCQNRRSGGGGGRVPAPGRRRSLRSVHTLVACSARPTAEQKRLFLRLFLVQEARCGGYLQKQITYLDAYCTSVQSRIILASLVSLLKAAIEGVRTAHESLVARPLREVHNWGASLYARWPLDPDDIPALNERLGCCVWSRRC